MKSLHFSAFLLWFIVTLPCRADVNAQAIALNCSNCHRENSNVSKAQIPALERLSTQQLTQYLMDFKYGQTQATLMPRIVKGYSDKELAKVAEYLSQHKF